MQIPGTYALRLVATSEEILIAAFGKRDVNAISNQLGALAENKLPLDHPDREHVLMPEVQGMNILEFADKVFGISFATRPAQELVLRVLYGLPIPKGEVQIYVEKPSIDGALLLEPLILTWHELYTMITGNEELPVEGVELSEAVLRIGRRGGKSFLVSLIIDYEATRSYWRQYLNKDEQGWAVITATRQEQAQNILLDTCYNFFKNSKLRFKYILEDKTTSKIVLRNGYRIAAYPCNSTAGLGLAAFIHAFDECAHYGTEGVKSDKKVVNALTPAQIQFSAHNPKTLYISTPAGKQGLFYELCEQGGNVPERLTIHAPSWVFNPPNAYGDPTYNILQKEYRRDPISFDRECRANFAEMMDSFFRPEEIDAIALLAGDLPYDPKNHYFWGADQSGLAGKDKFGFSVGHKDWQTGIIKIDYSRSWDFTSADEVMAKVGAAAKQYHLGTGMFDRYAKGWVQSTLSKIPLICNVRPSMAEIYVNMKSLALSGKLEIPFKQPLMLALKRTQAFYSKGNAMSIGHERTCDGHGDEADSVGTCVMAISATRWITTGSNSGREASIAALAKAESDYDPLNWGLN